MWCFSTNTNFAQNVYSLNQKPIFYNGCEQLLFVPLENSEKTTVKISQGEIQSTQESNVFSIKIPTNSSNINILVENDEKPAQNIPLKLSPVPAPDVLVGDKNEDKINFKFPINIEKEQKFIVRAKANDLFKMYAPKDATYKVKRLTVSQFRGGRRISALDINGDVFETDKITDLQTEDGIQIEILEVVRINYKGEEEQAPINNRLQSFYVGEIIGR